MAKTIITIITIFLILGVLSCEAPMGFMNDPMPNDEVVVKSIEDGAFLTEGDEIPLSLQYDPDEVVLEKLTIELFSSDEELLASQELGYAELQQEQLPSIDLPDIDPGLYTIEYTGFNSEGEIKLNREIAFFFTNGVYSVKNITSYPPVITPGTEALLAAHLQYPVSAEPYIRWSMGDEVLSEGPNNDKLQWNAPESEGVYSITVELFPFAPPKGSYEFSSTASMEAEFFVTSGRSKAENGFYPNKNYYSVFHFQGDWKDSGVRPVIGLVEPVGSPEVDVRGNLFGYYLDGSSGFKVNQMVLPVENGSISPFTAEVKLYIDTRPKNRSFFSTETEDGTFSFSISTDQDGVLKSTIISGERSFTSSSGFLLDPNSAYTIALSVVPGIRSVTLQWFVDGDAVKIEEQGLSVGQIGEEGSAIIGGPNGFRGVIDEFGIFFRDNRNRAAIDPNIYFKKSIEQYGSDLIYAEGFDGLYFPDSLEKNNLLSVEKGHLIIEPDGELDLPELSVSHERVSVEMEIASFLNSSDQKLTIAALDGSFEPVSVGFNGVVTSSSGQSRAIEYENGTIEAEFLHEEGIFSITINGKEVYSSENDGDFVPITLTVSNGISSGSLEIERILIFSESLRLVKNESTTAEGKTETQPDKELEEYSNT